MDDDGGCLVVPDLLQERGGVAAVIQHAHRQRVLGDQELPQQLLQVQKALGEKREKEQVPFHVRLGCPMEHRDPWQDVFLKFWVRALQRKGFGAQFWVQQGRRNDGAIPDVP